MIKSVLYTFRRFQLTKKNANVCVQLLLTIFSTTPTAESDASTVKGNRASGTGCTKKEQRVRSALSAQKKRESVTGNSDWHICLL